ncbi:hypothetical protein [Rubrivirga sp. IMCC45206]|uniref:hypothetical protein n=1 Tax=Rubrivirga sp. IMCC45206 TaxID=3391614 RepID=UPI00398FB7CE
MTQLALRQSGEYDAQSEVAVDAEGCYTAEHGGYVTGGRRSGRLTACDRRALDRLAAAVDLDARPPAQGAVVTTLVIGGRSVSWAGAPPTPALAALVGALVRLTR